MLQICKLCHDGVWRLTELAESEFQVYRVMRPQKWFFEVTGIRCKDESLHPIVKPFARTIDTDLDDAMQHIPNIVNQYDEAKTIAKMKRPSTSPDLNPIFHVWDVQQRQMKFSNWTMFHPIPKTLKFPVRGMVSHIHIIQDMA